MARTKQTTRGLHKGKTTARMAAKHPAPDVEEVEEGELVETSEKIQPPKKKKPKLRRKRKLRERKRRRRPHLQ